MQWAAGLHSSIQGPNNIGLCVLMCRVLYIYAFLIFPLAVTIVSSTVSRSETTSTGLLLDLGAFKMAKIESSALNVNVALLVLIFGKSVPAGVCWPSARSRYTPLFESSLLYFLASLLGHLSIYMCGGVIAVKVRNVLPIGLEGMVPHYVQIQ